MPNTKKYTRDKRLKKIGFDQSRAAEYFRLEKSNSPVNSTKSFTHKPYATDYTRSDILQ